MLIKSQYVNVKCETTNVTSKHSILQPDTLLLHLITQARLAVGRSLLSPVAVEVVQLLLHGAAEATSVVSVQPLAHHTHAVLALMFVKGKVLDLRGDATAKAWMGLVLHCSRCLWRHGNVAPAVQ